jgi:hypothetical protein
VIWAFEEDGSHPAAVLLVLLRWIIGIHGDRQIGSDHISGRWPACIPVNALVLFTDK